MSAHVFGDDGDDECFGPFEALYLLAIGGILVIVIIVVGFVIMLGIITGGGCG